MNNAIVSKKALAKTLSSLKGFKIPKVRLEQYMLSSDSAASLLWIALMNGDIQEKVICDLGAGTGILGIGALLLGAKKVIFVDCDKEALEITQKNIDSIKSEQQIGEFEILNEKVSDFSKSNINTIIQNPPFGTKIKHSDKEFLEKALRLAKSVYSIHKASTEMFLRAIAKDYNFNLFLIPQKELLKKTYLFHTKKREYINIVLAYFRKQ
ncbi:methyltransferase [Candidatus Woesearchaeota archaeon]|nr:methyltransferase [Candidatus Woesearchaeota archaeon]